MRALRGGDLASLMRNLRRPVPPPSVFLVRRWAEFFVIDERPSRTDLLKSLAISRDASVAGPVISGPPLKVLLGTVAVLVGVGGISLFGLVRLSGNSSASVEVAPPVPEPATQGRPSAILASGHVVARREATVSAQETGRIAELLVEEGDAVTRGQVLAILDAQVVNADARVLGAQQASAEAAVEAAQADLARTEMDLRRARDLHARGFVSEAGLDRAAAAASAAGALVRQRLADADLARYSVARQAEVRERYAVRAPFAGVVTSRNAEIGEIVSPISAGGGFTRTGIYTLVDMTSLEVEVQVSETSISGIGEGRPASIEIAALNGEALQGRVVSIIPSADRDRATVTVRIGFLARDLRLLPGMAVRVSLPPATSGQTG